MYSTVAVNQTDVHQTIIGLGGNYALGAIEGPYTGVAQDSVGNYTLQYLSPTEARVGLPLAQWAPTNDNGQGSPTWSGYQDSGISNSVFNLLKQLQAKNIQITLTAWNIPDWMCSNPTASTGREIAPGMESAYANAVASFIARAKSVYGVNISYFSVNEADGGYNVSLSTSQEAALIKTVGANFSRIRCRRNGWSVTCSPPATRCRMCRRFCRIRPCCRMSAAFRITRGGPAT